MFPMLPIFGADPLPDFLHFLGHSIPILLKRGERNWEKRLSVLKVKNGCDERSFIFFIQSKLKNKNKKKLGSLLCAF